MQNQRILQDLLKITAEEQAILDGKQGIDKSLYTVGNDGVFNSTRLLESGRLIGIRQHTRFIDFPEHSHDYIEVVYVCKGICRHIVNGKEICMKEGELLFLGQNARHSIRRSGLEDLVINLSVLPEFFSRTLFEIGVEDTPLRRFLLECLFNQETGPGYLYFCVSENRAVQNLMENLISTLMYEEPNRRKISQLTMTLLFLELMNQNQVAEEGSRDNLILNVLQYAEYHFADGSLAEAAKMLHLDESALSREIRRRTGRTYTELIQERRMARAALLLESTGKKVDDIARDVGYENISYFHRVFRKMYGMSPRSYRVSRQKKEN